MVKREDLKFFSCCLKLLVVLCRSLYNPSINFFEIFSLEIRQVLLNVQICFSVFLILYAFSENKLKCVSVAREYAKSI